MCSLVGDLVLDLKTASVGGRVVSSDDVPARGDVLVEDGNVVVFA